MITLPLESTHAARLLLRACVRAGRMRFLYDPDQPRDESGKWTSDAGGFLSKGGKRVTAFHGTPDKNLTVADLNPDTAIEVGGATFFTTDEDTAWQYTHEREYGEIVGDSSENVLKAQFRMTNPMVVDMDGEVGEAIKLSQLVREAKEKGHDGLILENIDDTVDSSGGKAWVGGRKSNHVTIAVFKKGQAVAGEGQLSLLGFNPDQPRDDHGQWTTGGSSYAKEVASKTPVISDGKVDGRETSDDVPNTSSISASLTDYEILDGIREVKLSEFEDSGKPSFYSVTEKARTEELATRIQVSGKITPLIVVYDGDKRGPYVLEGGHRFDALKIIGAKSMPAMVVIDKEKFRAGEFNPDQPRDDRGRWTDGGLGVDTRTGSPDRGVDTRTGSPDMEARRAKVEHRSKAIAAEMGVPTTIINVVDKEPRAFEVGNQQFKEAGHYNPATGMIEINARNSYDDRMSITNGIAAHEVSHAIYDAARSAQADEHQEINDLSGDEHRSLFRASGYVRPEMQAQVHERWPVSAMFYRHLGDSYMETEDEQHTTSGVSRFSLKVEALKNDDGVSKYSQAYWNPEVQGKSGALELAINETLAETTRHQVAPMSWHGGGSAYEPHESWRAWAEDLQKIVRLNKVKAKLGKRG